MKKVFIITACIIVGVALSGRAPASDQGKAAPPQVVNPAAPTAPTSAVSLTAPVSAIPAKQATAIPKAAPAPTVMAKQSPTRSLAPAKPTQVETLPGQIAAPPRKETPQPVQQAVQTPQPKPVTAPMRQVEQASVAKPAVPAGPKRVAPVRKLTSRINPAVVPVSPQPKPVKQLTATVATDRFQPTIPGFKRLINQQKMSQNRKAASKAVSVVSAPQRARVQSAATPVVQQQRVLRPSAVGKPVQSQVKPTTGQVRANTATRAPISNRLNPRPSPKPIPGAVKTAPVAQASHAGPVKKSPISKPLVKAAPVRPAGAVKQSPIPRQVSSRVTPTADQCKQCPKHNAAPKTVAKPAPPMTAPVPAVAAPKKSPIPKEVVPAAKTAAAPKPITKPAPMAAQQKPLIQAQRSQAKVTAPASSPATVPIVEAKRAAPAKSGQWTKTPASAGQKQRVQSQPPTPAAPK